MIQAGAQHLPGERLSATEHYRLALSYSMEPRESTWSSMPSS